MKRTEKIKTKLTVALKPEHLEVIDDSAQHHGHGGYDSEGSHFTVIIKAGAFNNLSMVACHKLVYQALGELMQTDIHALQIKIVR